MLLAGSMTEIQNSPLPEILSVFFAPYRVLTFVNGEQKGFSLIEVVIVMLLIALTLTLAGPRIGAGLGRLELEQAGQSLRSFVRTARVQAQRTDRDYYIAIDARTESMTLLDPDFKKLREEKLPASVEFVVDSPDGVANVVVSAAGIARSRPILLRGRTGELKVELQ